jgi:hypothetical protein
MSAALDSIAASFFSNGVQPPIALHFSLAQVAFMQRMQNEPTFSGGNRSPVDEC